VRGHLFPHHTLLDCTDENVARAGRGGIKKDPINRGLFDFLLLCDFVGTTSLEAREPAMELAKMEPVKMEPGHELGYGTRGQDLAGAAPRPFSWGFFCLSLMSGINVRTGLPHFRHEQI
jgi:hypothetical protein